MKTIAVSVAVIFYKQQYLLGFRNSSQHQGNRYEFVGGKVEGTETAEHALIREVDEEVGLDIRPNKRELLGVIEHVYSSDSNKSNSSNNNNDSNSNTYNKDSNIKDNETKKDTPRKNYSNEEKAISKEVTTKKEMSKKVRLHVYQIELTNEQYQSLIHLKTGKENQRIAWVNKLDLLDKKYPLPEANGKILHWLSRG